MWGNGGGVFLCLCVVNTFVWGSRCPRSCCPFWVVGCCDAACKRCSLSVVCFPRAAVHVGCGGCSLQWSVIVCLVGQIATTHVAHTHAARGCFGGGGRPCGGSSWLEGWCHSWRIFLTPSSLPCLQQRPQCCAHCTDLRHPMADVLLAAGSRRTTAMHAASRMQGQRFWGHAHYVDAGCSLPWPVTTRVAWRRNGCQRPLTAHYGTCLLPMHGTRCKPTELLLPTLVLHGNRAGGGVHIASVGCKSQAAACSAAPALCNPIRWTHSVKITPATVRTAGCLCDSHSALPVRLTPWFKPVLHLPPNPSTKLPAASIYTGGCGRLLACGCSVAYRWPTVVVAANNKHGCQVRQPPACTCTGVQRGEAVPVMPGVPAPESRRGVPRAGLAGPAGMGRPSHPVMPHIEIAGRPRPAICHDDVVDVLGWVQAKPLGPVKPAGGGGTRAASAGQALL